MLPSIVTVCPLTGKTPRLAPVPTTTLLVTVNVLVTVQLALAGTMRLPLTVLPGLGFGGQVVSAARTTGSATNMSPNARIAVSKCFMVFVPLFRRRASKSARTRAFSTRPSLDILMGAGFAHNHCAPPVTRLGKSLSSRRSPVRGSARETQTLRWRGLDSNHRFLMEAGPNARVINLSAMAMCAMASSCHVAIEVGSAGAGRVRIQPESLSRPLPEVCSGYRHHEYTYRRGSRHGSALLLL